MGQLDVGVRVSESDENLCRPAVDVAHYSQTPCFCNPLFMQIATKRKPLRSLN